ncbi:response regulator transcription factor [Synechocystis salina]|uniref:Response regulator transcription factor n=1 Tax=Synechocystis salina LEGE 00031 TaxID=1828736 RepID=A0ABR9VXD6_9SYNC|nr:response regulator transcription factor [Synechocystis salina]MBE9242461.1 response regulator transcription factor [Synechocystis salina LEGE 00041]MBE9255543.1 response regulator transcription factor [Synechocystis salina LEGE 00031]
MSQSKENYHLLLVDDDPNLLLLVKDYLEYQGYQVTTAGNGREALAALVNMVPDMIICDIMMPEMDGYAFIEQVRQNPSISWIPVMFLSAKGQSHNRVKGLNVGADIYMAKPFEPEELAAQVQSCLRQADRLLQHNNHPLGDNSRVQVARDVELTPTETKVIQLVAQGLANREIADHLKVSQRTVESHVSNMLNKTGLHNRTELARWAIQKSIA